MDLISSRERKIILYLLRSRHQFVSIRELAEYINVSSRTIHRELRQVERTLSAYSTELTRVPGSGIKLTGNSQALEDLQDAMRDAEEIDTTQEERTLQLLELLVDADEPVKTAYLAQAVQLSKSALPAYLEGLESRIQAFNLLLERRRGIGITLVGDESDKRKALVQLFIEQLDQASIYTFSEDREVTHLQHLFHGFMEEQFAAKVEKYVMDYLGKLPYSIADNAYIGLIIYISLAINRIQRNKTVTIDKKLLVSLEKTTEYRIAKELSRELESSFAISIDEAEIGYIAIQMQSAKRSDSLYYADPLFELQAQAFIHVVSLKLQLPHLEEDPTFTEGLLAHLEPAINRAREGIQTYNPLTERINQDYQEVVQAVTEGLASSFPDYTFAQGEIAFLALHFASAMEKQRSRQHLSALVVCSSGIGTSKMLASRLQKEFPEISHVQLSSFMEVKKLAQESYDLIISTIGLDIDDTYLLVNPLLPPEDVRKADAYIMQQLPSIYARRKEPRTVPVSPEREARQLINKIPVLEATLAIIKRLLQQFHIQHISDVEKSHNHQLISMIDKAAYKAGVIKEKELLSSLLIHREEQGGMGIPDTNMALYHARDSAIAVPAFWMMVLPSPITIKGMDNLSIQADRIFVLLAPDNLPRESYEIFSKISSFIIEETVLPAVQEADEAKLYTALEEMLAAHIHQQTAKL